MGQSDQPITTRYTGKLIIWRRSVCAGDDVDAPHELVLKTHVMTLRDLATHLLKIRYPASIAGGKATWILEAVGKKNRPLAVLAQQWSEPRYLVDPDTDITAFINPGNRYDLYLNYWCQIDPDIAFDHLQHGKPLPN
ncbi:MAG TPA: hypothetical protein VHV83_02525 [Armatimonadota bacterium]|nr:hypothetical protein [Armatimonadota bacterium]